MVDQRCATAPATPLDRTGDLSRARAFLEVAVILAALLVIPTILLQHYGSSPSIIAMAKALDWGIWLIFATELAVVLWDRRSRHRLLLLDAFIVVVSFPLLPASLAAFRLARLARITPALRVLRLVRLAAVLLRTGVAMRRLTRRRGLLHVGSLTLVTALGAAVGFILLEPDRHSFLDGLWWAVSTITTVGYGDYYPVSTAGRALAVLLMVCGIGLVAVFTAAVAAHFVEDDGDEALATLRRIEARLVALEEKLESVERSDTRAGSGGAD
jgi:voltage-gated potassium channel